MKIAIVATRVSGTDGVSLEALRWREVLEGMGHKVTTVAGKLDHNGILIDELYFQDPEVIEIHDKVVYGRGNYRLVEREIFELAGKIEGKLRDVFNSKRDIDLLIVPNVFSLPVHFPLAVALARVIEEKRIATIARHHDFWWERARYKKSSMFPFFERWFPPQLPNLKHVVINSLAQKEFKKRTSLDSEVIWDCFDFRQTAKIDSFSKYFRKDFKISEQDIIFLQATRIVPRKRIELAIELVTRLNDPRIVFVIAGHEGDEAGDYGKKLRQLVKKTGIRCRFIGHRIDSKRRMIKNDGSIKRIYSLWDCFLNSDFVTYPTEIEGFGNQFVEAVYFKKPIILTPYPVFVQDIAPLDFETIQMPDKVTSKVVEEVKELINNPEKVTKMVNKNHDLGQKYFSYVQVENKLKKIFQEVNL